MTRKAVDHLGLRTAMADRVMPMLVAAMSFLAALAIAGTLAASVLAVQWNRNAGAALTVQVPDAGDPAATGPGKRLDAVLAVLSKAAGVSEVHVLSAAEMDALLKPWLGSDAGQLAMPVPAVISAEWAGAGQPDGLAASLNAVAPGSLVETGARWAARVAALTGSLQAAAVSVLVIVAVVAAAVISVATRAGLAQRREAIEIIHGLGALDGDIAGRFASRATLLAAIGGLIGAACALPVLYWLARLAAPFGGVVPTTPLPGAALPVLPLVLWVALPAIPVVAALIGWVTTQFTVRGWLRQLA
jgi:cell division transport system permease protein